jgi:cytoskeleton-binding toxin CbtA-like protein
MKLPFAQTVDTLLTHCFGISILDTNLCEEECVASLIDAGITPTDAVNAVSEKHDLCRLDIKGMYGLPVCNELSEEESEEIITNWLDRLHRQELDAAYSLQFILTTAR